METPKYIVPVKKEGKREFSSMVEEIATGKGGQGWTKAGWCCDGSLEEWGVVGKINKEDNEESKTGKAGDGAKQADAKWGKDLPDFLLFTA